MKKIEVKVGGFYTAKVSDKLVTVRIDSTHSRTGWNATNTATGKRIHIKSAQRLRSVAKSSASTEAGEAPKATVANDAKAGAPAKATSKEARSKKTRKAKDSPGGVAMTVFRNQALVDKAIKKGKAKAADEQKPKRISALDAAAQVLKETNRPMRATELIDAMAERKLWKSPAGATPHATLYAAMTREARDKGDASRFAKVDRGLFAFNG